MRKGARTRASILSDAVNLASVVGLEGLSIGSLAEQTQLSKSGLFAHFGSKEQLQIATLESAIELFRTAVIGPALKAPRGIKRLRVLFDLWLAWDSGGRANDGGPPGGCPFISASFEQDDREGPVREYVVGQQRAWIAFIAETVAKAVGTGDLRDDVDPVQFAHEMNGYFLMFHQAKRLLRDPDAEDRTRTSFERLLKDARRDQATS